MILPTVSTFQKIRSGKISFWRRELVSVLRILALLFLIIAAARPQLGHGEEKVTTEGIDIILGMDVSGSMLAEDFQPNRLEAAKVVLKDFIKEMEGNRLGLVAFAKVALTQCPLTTDYHVIEQLINELDPQTINIDGTAIGDAIGTAVNKFVDEDIKSRVIILLTDGENNSGIDPILTAQIAHDKGVKIYAIGVGTEEGAPIPQYDVLGRKVYQRIGNKVVRTRLDETTLRQIADYSGGKYFRATDTTSLRQIYLEIAEMEKHKIETTEYTVYNELYSYFLVPGFLILMFELFIFTGRNRRMV
jgi:Ca-activated chloride channel family protein